MAVVCYADGHSVSDATETLRAHLQANNISLLSPELDCEVVYSGVSVSGVCTGVAQAVAALARAAPHLTPYSDDATSDSHPANPRKPLLAPVSTVAEERAYVRDAAKAKHPEETEDASHVVAAAVDGVVGGSESAQPTPSSEDMSVSVEPSDQLEGGDVDGRQQAPEEGQRLSEGEDVGEGEGVGEGAGDEVTGEVNEAHSADAEGERAGNVVGDDDGDGVVVVDAGDGDGDGIGNDVAEEAGQAEVEAPAALDPADNATNEDNTGNDAKAEESG